MIAGLGAGSILEPVRKLGDELAHAEAVEPMGRGGLDPVVGAGDLATDGGTGVGGVAYVGRRQDGLLEALRVREAPERRLETLDDVS